MKVFIGVGHGGRDYGACANGLRESEIALDIALKMYDVLEAHGVEVAISRVSQGTDKEDDLKPKIDRCNANNPDLAVDIHINAGGGRGFEALYYSGGGKSLTLAQNIEAEVIKMGQTSRGLKTRLNNSGKDYFGFIRQVKAPSVILEAAFIDNSADVEKIRTVEGRHKFGIAYANGVLKTLGIKPAKKEPSNKEPYRVKVTADALNVRAGAGTKYKINGQITDKGVYTIVDEKDGWGKLKSGKGWVSLKYTQKA